MSRFVPDGSVIRRPGMPFAFLLGSGRMILMQFAHPLVAKGIAEHSQFRENPLLRAVRISEGGAKLIFRGDEDALQAAATIRASHERVRGAGYSANDPALLLWVHATTIDSILRVYSALVGPLSDADADRFYQETKTVAELVGCPREAQPVDLAAFRLYVDEMIGSLEVSGAGRNLARDFLYLPVRFWGRPLLAIARLVTLGMLPSVLRAQYGFRWSPVHRAAFLVLKAIGRLTWPILDKLTGRGMRGELRALRIARVLGLKGTAPGVAPGHRAT